MSSKKVWLILETFNFRKINLTFPSKTVRKTLNLTHSICKKVQSLGKRSLNFFSA